MPDAGPRAARPPVSLRRVRLVQPCRRREARARLGERRPEVCQAVVRMRAPSLPRQCQPLDESGAVVVDHSGGTEGALEWDPERRGFDDSEQSGAPPTLQGSFEEEPRYTDLTGARQADRLSLDDPRFRDDVADLGAALHGRPKDTLRRGALGWTLIRMPPLGLSRGRPTASKGPGCPLSRSQPVSAGQLGRKTVEPGVTGAVRSQPAWPQRAEAVLSPKDGAACARLR